MYGYLKYSTPNKKSEDWNTYRRYYCGLCNALKKNYGVFSTMLLSNDITFITIIVANQSLACSGITPKCCLLRGCKRIRDEYKNDFWKAMSAFTLALAYAKAYDNYIDKDGVVSSLIQMMFLKIISRKARKEYGELFEYLIFEMNNLREAENNCCGVTKQGELFSDVIISSLTDYLHVEINENCMHLIRGIIKWLCLIDAIDDYDKDIKKRSKSIGCTSPIANELFKDMDFDECFDSWRLVFNTYYMNIARIYNDILRMMIECLNEINKATCEFEIIKQMVYNIMPQKMIKAMKLKEKNYNDFGRIL